MNNESTAGKAALPAGKYSLEPSETTLKVIAKHFGFASVSGDLAVLSGSFSVDEDGRILDVEVVADAASYTSGTSKRDEHIAGSDFLDSEAYPTTTFRAAGSIPGEGGRYEVEGSVDVKGRTSPLEAEVTDVSFEGSAGSLTASATVDRREVGAGKLPSLVIGNLLALEFSGKVTLA